VFKRRDIHKTQQQVKKELTDLRRRIVELEQLESVPTREPLTGAEEELKAILNDIRHGIMLLDLTGKIISINKKITEISGYTEKDIVGKRLNRLRMFSPLDTTTLLSAFIQVISGKTLTVEVEAYAKTGEKLFVEIDGTLLRIGGKTERVIAFVRDVTARRQAEEALRESEEELNAIFNEVRDGIVLLDLTGKIIKINKRIVEVTGYTEKYIVGKRFDFFKNFHPSSIAKMTATFIKAVAGQRVSPFEVIGYTKTGEKRFGEVYGSLIKKKGKAAGVLVVMTDITERKQAEDAQRESENRYRTLVDNIDLGINLIDTDHNIIFANSTESGKFNKPVSEMIGKKCYREFEKRDVVCPHCPGEQTIATGRPAEAEAEGVRDDGSRFQVRLRTFPVVGQDGKVTAFIEITEDITERKRMEKALRESEQKHRSILATIKEGYAEVDLAGNFTFFNDALCKIHGRTRDEMMGLNNRAYMTPETAKRIYTIFNKVYKTGIPATIVDNEIIRKDGSIALLEESISLLRNAAGEPIGFYGVSRDRTEQKKAEMALRESEEKYRSILSTMEEGYYEVDLAGNLTFFNDALSRIYGYARDELMGMNNREYMNPLTAQKIYQLFNKVYKTGKPSKIFDWEFVKKDGTIITIEISVSLRKDSQGNAIGFRGIVRDITERKQAEEALREREENYRSILELAPDSITISRLADGRYLQVNNAFCRHTGYTPEDVVGRTAFDLNIFVNPSDREQLVKAVRRGRAEGLEIQFRAKDGTILNDLVSAIPIRFQSDDCQLVIATNINALKKAQEALSESEQKYRTILQNMEEGYFEVDLRGNITFFNDATCRNQGRSREELLGMNNREYMTPEMAKKTYAIYNKVYRTGNPARFIDIEIIRKDGTMAMLEESVSLLRNAAGEPIGFFGVSRDRTEQKKAEEALRQSEEKYRTIIENIEDGYYEVDLAGNFTFVNDALCRIQGYTRNEMIGMNNREYMDKKTAQKVYKIFNAVLRTGKSTTITHWQIFRKDKSKREVESSVSLMRDPSGNPRGFRGVIRDITVRKQAEEELQYRATHDVLTDLPNRLLFSDRLALALMQAQRNQKRLAVMMLDMDYFKNVNDTMGHSAGDRLLRVVGNRLTELLRSGDTVARVGGDEFLLLLSEIGGIEDANTIAQKILEAFRRPFILDDQGIMITTSIGVAIFPDDGDNADILVKYADVAMYRAKDEGRDNFQRYAPV
jgi:diguanylate cyclase (GGDEF)-like protein/PAS domain S-box-containing protein